MKITNFSLEECIDLTSPSTLPTPIPNPSNYIPTKSISKKTEPSK